MHWLEEYKEDIINLRKVHNEIFLKDLKERSKEIFKEYEKLVKPLRDGKLDPGDMKIMADSYLKTNLKKVIDEKKRESAIHRRLATLYERLADASEEDWAIFAKMCVEAEFSSQTPLWEFFADSFKSND